MGKDAGLHAHGDAFRALREQEREAHRELGRLLVAAVVGGHPVGDLRVEDHFLGELGEPRLDVSGRGVGVAGEDVAPVSLAIHREALLAQLHEGAQDGRVAVRVVLHRLADDVRHLGVPAVVHLVHRVQDAALDGLQAVHDVRDGALEDHVGRIVQEPVLEHAGQLELPAVAAQQAGELARRLRVFVKGLLFVEILFLVEGLFLDVVEFFAHSRFRFRTHSRSGGVPCETHASPDPLSRTWRGRPSSGRSPPSPGGLRCPLSSGRRPSCR